MKAISVGAVVGTVLSGTMVAAQRESPGPPSPICNGVSEDTLPMPNCGTSNINCGVYIVCPGSGWLGDKKTQCCFDSEDPLHNTGCTEITGKWKCCEATSSWKKHCSVSAPWTAGMSCHTVESECQ